MPSVRGSRVIAGLSLPVARVVRDGDVLIRRVAPEDLDAIILLLADDPISAGRGDVAREEGRPAYSAALRWIIDDPGNDLVVAVERSGAVVGRLQLTVIPGMARRGATRLLVEAVRSRNAEAQRLTRSERSWQQGQFGESTAVTMTSPFQSGPWSDDFLLLTISGLRRITENSPKDKR